MYPEINQSRILATNKIELYGVRTVSYNVRTSLIMLSELFAPFICNVRPIRAVYTARYFEFQMVFRENTEHERTRTNTNMVFSRDIEHERVFC